MPAALLVAVLLQGSAPELRERYPAEPPGQEFLLVNLDDGRVVRGNPDAGRRFPLGEAERALLLIAGLEEGALETARQSACDSSCWAQGAHGTTDLVQALAVSCDSWFADATGAVGGEMRTRWLARLGIGEEGATLREWTELWRGLMHDTLELRLATTAAILTGAGLSVALPRGAGRVLHDPQRRVRAIVGGSAQGTWVTGTLHRRGPIDWAFALWVPGSSPGLAAARAGSLLDGTLRRHEAATRERGGKPPAPVRADRREP